MKKWLPAFLLWLAVLIAVGGLIWWWPSDSGVEVQVDTGQLPGELAPVGAVMETVPWKYLPTLPPFELTDQNGDRFDSSELAGEAFVVNFFFASCPSICRDFNARIAELNSQLRDTDIRFVSITVDPRNDTPEVLKRYAQDYGAELPRWAFLTGEPYQIKQLGEQGFRVVIDKATHTDNLLLVDRWGRFRDRFKWDDAVDTKRFLKVAREVAAETEPPVEGTVRTRNAMAGIEPPSFREVPWIREFWLTERSGEPFYSRDLIGEVWIGSFFFTSCPGICTRHNEYLAGLEDRLVDHPARLVSITTDPNHDSPAVLREYASKLGADPERWLFCQGNELLTKRIGAEFFTASTSGNHHSSNLFLVDKWGQVRGEFDWQQPAEEAALLEWIDRLNAETAPPARIERRKP